MICHILTIKLQKRIHNKWNKILKEISKFNSLCIATKFLSLLGVKVVVVEDSVAVVVPSVVGRVPTAQPPIRGLRRSANIALNESLRSFHYLWTENAIKGILLAVSTLTIYTT